MYPYVSVPTLPLRLTDSLIDLPFRTKQVGSTQKHVYKFQA